MNRAAYRQAYWSGARKVCELVFLRDRVRGLRILMAFGESLFPDFKNHEALCYGAGRPVLCPNDITPTSFSFVKRCIGARQQGLDAVIRIQMPGSGTDAHG